MSILDSLLSVKETTLEMQQGVFKSKMLQRFLKAEEPIEVIYSELPSKRIKTLLGKQFDNKGNFSWDNAQRTKALLVAESLKDPYLRDERLLEKFDSATPADLAEKLFGMEIIELSDRICALSGITLGEEEAQKEFEEIKN